MAANQRVEQQQRVQEQQIADLQVRMGIGGLSVLFSTAAGGNCSLPGYAARLASSHTTPPCHAGLQAGLQQRIAERRKKAGRWLSSDTAAQQQQARQQQQQQPPDQQQPDQAASGPDLGAYARGGLQRKVSRFAEYTNALLRSQADRGAGISWGRQEPISSSGWEEELGVRRVQRGSQTSSQQASAAPFGRASLPPQQSAAPNWQQLQDEEQQLQQWEWEEQQRQMFAAQKQQPQQQPQQWEQSPAVQPAVQPGTGWRPPPADDAQLDW